MSAFDAAWFDFFGHIAELNAIITIRDMDEDLRADLKRIARELEDWRVTNLGG